MWNLLVFVTIFQNINLATGCPRSCPQYIYKPHENRSKLITYFPGIVEINKISLVGTRESMGYKINFDRNQNLELIDQLNFGVRVLDVGVRATSNRFAVHKGAWFMNVMFGSVINTVDSFLKTNPREFVIMLIHETYSAASNVTKSTCEILEDYRNHRMITNWTLNDPVRKLRGKLLIATIGDKAFSKCVTDLKPQCKLSSQLIKVEHYDRQIETKKRELKALQEASFIENYKCFISYLSDRYMNSRFDVAVRGTDRYCDEPINFFMGYYFDNSYRGLIILLADYPTQELIDQVNHNNYYCY